MAAISKTKKQHAGFFFNMLALGFFFPGIFLTMFTFDMEMMVILSSSEITAPLVGKSLSIMATVQTLWQDNRYLVAVLIFAFSVCIPLIKLVMVSIAYFIKERQVQAKLLNIVNTIGKWSMADVFVVAVFLAVLSTNHAETTTVERFSVFGFEVAVEISSQTLSQAGEGLAYFTAYCLLSMLGAQLMTSSSNTHAANTSIRDEQ
jgi:paraquat-inducible protein A